MTYQNTTMTDTKKVESSTKTDKEDTQDIRQKLLDKYMRKTDAWLCLCCKSLHDSKVLCIEHLLQMHKHDIIERVFNNE